MKFNKGFTLIEIIVVVSILGILAVIAIPRLSGFIDNVNREVCNYNCRNIERSYQLHLMEEGIGYSDLHFTEFLEETDQLICPKNGHISYKDGKAECNVHNIDEDEDDEEVPYL